MEKLKKVALVGLTAVAMMGCKPGGTAFQSYDEYPVRGGSLTEMDYSPAQTTFTLWAPTAGEVVVNLYNSGHLGEQIETVQMQKGAEGTWSAVVAEDLLGRFYTFRVKIDGEWLDETQGINVRAVGVNGDRGAIINWQETHPEGWEADVRPELKSPADIIVYEMHFRDVSVHSSSGMQHKGKFLALTEAGTKVPDTKIVTGIDHLKELGVTHVHLLPSFDYASIDETHLEENNYNWGYDPKNYNVPEGSYSADPYDPYVRIREFKQMVQALHRAGIRVVLDVVYNHTYDAGSSPFERTVPGYFYRLKPDGIFANASGCGNEIASERAMMRKYMIESVVYWATEYHIDGFRFDLMGIHDIETMNEIRKALNEVDPTICIYGEGWAAETPLYPGDLLAMKGLTARMPGIAAFSDELRDALRGPVMDNAKGGFLARVSGNEESLKYGIAGAINHPQIDFEKVNYTDTAWAVQPTQMISYASCHDDMCLADRLKANISGISEERLLRLNKLAQTAVFTSQGIPFIYAGEEILRDKKGVHNSYKSPDSINAIDWTHKEKYADLYAYYKGMIALRKNHPAFRMGDADLIRKHLEFLPADQENVVAFCLKDNANGDAWKEIIVVLNACDKAVNVTVPAGTYRVACLEGKIDEKGKKTVSGPVVSAPKESALILYR